MCHECAMLVVPPPDVDLTIIGWLASTPREFAMALIEAGSFHHFEPGEPLHHAGDHAGGFWGIATGQAMSASGIGGPDASLSAMFLAGEWGGTGPISGFPRQLDVLARVPSVVLHVPQWSAARLLADRPEWWQAFNLLHFQLLVKFGLLAADLQITNSRARVAGILLNAAGIRRDGDSPVRFAATQEEVGRMAGLSRYPAAKVLRALARNRLITSHYGWIEIIEPAALRAIADGAQ
jgi:CRP/FNR family transcriptional regulator, cyclic AMP receptor protein